MPDPTNVSPKPEPNEKLIKIFDTEQETEAIVVRGLLESAGIDSDLKSIDAVQDAFPGVGGIGLSGARSGRAGGGEDYRCIP